jgi:hypothetical protein
MIAPNFKDLPIFWKVLIVIGSIAILLIFCLVIAVLHISTSKEVPKDSKVDSNDDFFREFMGSSDYPTLPKIKDFEGNYLRDLLEIKIL